MAHNGYTNEATYFIGDLLVSNERKLYEAVRASRAARRAGKR